MCLNLKYSKYSLLLSVIGIFIAYMIFPPFNITFGKWSMIAIPVGFVTYLIGIGYGITAFRLKEKGFLKYVSVLSLPLGVLYIVFMAHVFGGEI